MGINKSNSKRRNVLLTQGRRRRTGIKDEAKTKTATGAESKTKTEGDQKRNDDNYYYARTLRVKLVDIEKSETARSNGTSESMRPNFH
jgi:hypothetical protein